MATDASRLSKNASSMPGEPWSLKIDHYHHVAASNYAKKLLLFRLLYVNVKTHTYKHCLPLSKRRLPTQIPFMHASAVFF